MTNPTPTPAQRHLLEALTTNSGDVDAFAIAKAVTIRACRANGWIKRLPCGPYEIANYVITTAGRTAVERKARPAAERAKIAQDARSGNARARRLDAAAELLREAGWTVTRPQEHETVWCEAHGGLGNPHFEQADCLHPHFTDARTRARLNGEAKINP